MNRIVLRRRAVVLSFLAFTATALVHAAEPSPAPSAADQAAIRQVLESYRTAWLANDREGVLRLFTPDAVLMPHHGVAPVVGRDAARAFWFPANAPPTTVIAFTQTIDAIGGACDLAHVRGRSRVAWTVGVGPDAKRSGTAGTNLTILRRQADGSWRIAVQMWDDPPAN